MHILTLCVHEPVTVSPDATVAESIKLMLKRRIGAVVVVEGKVVKGIFTERDVLKKVALSGHDPAKTLVSEVMTSPVENASPQTTPGRSPGLDAEASFSSYAGGGCQRQAERCALDSRSAPGADAGNQAAARIAGTLCQQRTAGNARSSGRYGLRHDHAKDTAAVHGSLLPVVRRVTRLSRFPERRQSCAIPRPRISGSSARPRCRPPAKLCSCQPARW